MLRLSVFVAVMMAAVGVLGTHVPISMVHAQDSTPTIVPSARTATPTSAGAFCDRTKDWTPIAGRDRFGSVWSLIVDEVRVEDQAVIPSAFGGEVTAPSQPDTDYATVLLTATNVSTDVQDYPFALDLRLYDDQGRTYALNREIYVRWELFLQPPTIAWEPGGTYQIAVAYLVPADRRPTGLVSSDGSLCLAFGEGTPTAK